MWELISAAGRYAEPRSLCASSSGVARLLSQHNVLKLQLLKPTKDVGLVALNEWTDRDRGRSRFEGTALHLQVSLDIRLECFEVGVTQDVLDGHRGNTGL